MKDKTILRKLLWKEFKYLLLFIGLGLFLIVFNPDVGSWKYPLGFTQEVREVLRAVGYGILIAGYPVFLLTRIFASLILKLIRRL